MQSPKTFHFIWVPIICSTFVIGMTMTRSKEDEIHNITSWTGQNITLICDSQRREKDIQMLWQKDDVLLTVANIIAINDARLSLHGNSNELTINKVKMADEGTYKCLIPRTPIYTNAFVLRVKDQPGARNGVNSN